MKIGYITSSISYQGGWDTLSKGIVTAISKHHDVKVLTARGTVSDVASYPVLSVLPKKYISFGLMNQLRVFFYCIKHFRDRDALHVLIEPFGPGAALASFFLRLPFFITLAGTYSAIPRGGGLRGLIKRSLMKFMYKKAVYIATGSNRNIELIEEVMSLGNKWKFVPFGVDLEKFKNLKSFEKNADPFILTVGAVKERKGADFVVKALSVLKDEFPNLKYKIAGDDKAKPLFVKRLKELIQDKGLVNRVELLGRVEEEKLLEYYSECVAFVLAAQTIGGAFEGFPMVFYEAQALGAPVISTYGFGSEYVIKDGYNGFLVPQGDYLKLAAAIKKILVNSDLREELSRNSRKEAEKHSWDDVSIHYLDAYKKFIRK